MVQFLSRLLLIVPLYTTDTALELKRIEDEAKVNGESEEETDDPLEIVTSTKTEEVIIDDKAD